MTRIYHSCRAIAIKVSVGGRRGYGIGGTCEDKCRLQISISIIRDTFL